MKHTIEGFNQAYAMTLRKEVEQNGKIVLKKIDCTDLVILRWFVDFYPKMSKVTIDGKQYATLSHNKLLNDLPLIDISKKAFIERMKKLADFGILEYKFLKDIGSVSVYGFGENYLKLIEKDENESAGCTVESIGGSRSNGQGVAVQTDTIYNSIKDNSIKNIKYIVELLNEKAGTAYRTNSKSTVQHINARLAEGYTLDDFRTVIEKKCAEWKGGTMEQYLRPETLFGTKFENYLNAPSAKPKPSTYRNIENRSGKLDERPTIDDIEF